VADSSSSVRRRLLWHGDVSRRVRTWRGDRHALSALRTHGARQVCRDWNGSHRLSAQRSDGRRPTMLRQTPVWTASAGRRAGEHSSLSTRTQVLPWGRLHLRSRYQLILILILRASRHSNYAFLFRTFRRFIYCDYLQSDCNSFITLH